MQGKPPLISKTLRYFPQLLPFWNGDELEEDRKSGDYIGFWQGPLGKVTKV